MDVLIIIDMLNGFCRKGYLLSLSDSTEKVESYIISRIYDIQQNGGKVIFCCDNHLPTDPEFKQYPLHCIQGTKEAEIVDTLIPFTVNATVLTKTTLSSFYNTGLDNILMLLKPTSIEITGVCTDICVLQAASELRNRGYNVVVSKAGVLATSSENQDFFLSYMNRVLGVEIV